MVLTICLNGTAPFNKMGAMPLYGKNIFHVQESFDAESWYIASGTQGLPNCSKDYRRLTFDHFTARSNLH